MREGSRAQDERVCPSVDAPSWWMRMGTRAQGCQPAVGNRTCVQEQGRAVRLEVRGKRRAGDSAGQKMRSVLCELNLDLMEGAQVKMCT